MKPGPTGFLLRTSAGELRTESVVVCRGAYQRPHRPEVAAGFPRDVPIDARGYRNPTALPRRPPLELDLNGFGAVVFTSGFRPDYGRWIRFPAFDAMGFPLTDNGGATTPATATTGGLEQLETTSGSP